MKIITEPSVYLVGKQTVNEAELDRFLSDHGVSWETDSEVAGEVLSEVGGRLCYLSFAKPRPGGNAAYLAHIKEVGHGSVLEHAVYNLLITGVSRSLTHELIRHRVGMSPSQVSQRYVDESVAEYVEPDIIANDPELHAIWLDAVQHAHNAYVRLAEGLVERDQQRAFKAWSGENVGLPRNALRDWAKHHYQPSTEVRKAARQAARSVLPNACETKIFVTGNARALRHFIEMRGSVHAEPEIRKLANRVLAILVADSPNLFGDYACRLLNDGTYEITTQYPKC
jgi:thymidylate synthase (FAD)